MPDIFENLLSIINFILAIIRNFILDDTKQSYLADWDACPLMG